MLPTMMMMAWMTMTLCDVVGLLRDCLFFILIRVSFFFPFRVLELRVWSV